MDIIKSYYDRYVNEDDLNQNQYLIEQNHNQNYDNLYGSLDLYPNVSPSKYR